MFRNLHGINKTDPPKTKPVRLLLGDEKFVLPASNILDDNGIATEEESLRNSVLSLDKLFDDTKDAQKSNGATLSAHTHVHSVGTENWDARELETMVATPSLDDITKVSQQQPLGIDDDWHIIPERSLTEEEKRDLRIIENRQHIDPKRFYKSMGSGRSRGQLPSCVQFGTVVVGPHEFYSARIPRRQRRARVINELLADGDASRYIRNRGKRYTVEGLTNRRIVDPAAKRRKRRR